MNIFYLRTCGQPENKVTETEKGAKIAFNSEVYLLQQTKKQNREPERFNMRTVIQRLHLQAAFNDNQREPGSAGLI